MNRVMAHAGTDNTCWVEEKSYAMEWLWQCLWLALIVSLFALIYLNFSIRVNTAKLNSLMRQSMQLQVARDSMLLEKERLQMHHRTERQATEVLGYRLAKKMNVVTITV